MLRNIINDLTEVLTIDQTINNLNKKRNNIINDISKKYGVSSNTLDLLAMKNFEIESNQSFDSSPSYSNELLKLKKKLDKNKNEK